MAAKKPVIVNVEIVHAEAISILRREGKGGDISLKDSYQALITEWTSGNLDARVEGGESAQELADRLKDFLKILNQRNEKKTLICTHGRTLRSLMCLVNDEPLYEMEKYKHSNTGLFLVRKTKAGLELLKNNDTSHLVNMMIG